MIEDQHLLNAALEKLRSGWCNRWSMIINSEKTVCRSITSKTNVFNYQSSIGSTQLWKVESVSNWVFCFVLRYVGIIM